MVLEDRKDQLFISMLEAQQVRRTLSGIIWLWGLGCYSHNRNMSEWMGLAAQSTMVQMLQA